MQLFSKKKVYVLLIHCHHCLSSFCTYVVCMCLCCMGVGDLLLSKDQHHEGIELATWRLNSTAVITKLFSIIVALKRLEPLTSGTSHLKAFKPLGEKKLLFRKWKNSSCVSLKDLEILCKMRLFKNGQNASYLNKILNHTYLLLCSFS